MLKAFRIVGYLEGLSYILLLFVGLPLKYLAADPSWVKALGMPHGILFMLYLFLAYQISEDLKWPRKMLAYAFAASLLPLGTLIFDRKFISRYSHQK